MQINKGCSNFENSVSSLQRIIEKENPDIICISEANIRRSREDSQTQFPGYRHELNLMSQNIDISRNSIMINEKLNYKRRIDLESEETCNIWIEVIIDRKKVLIMGGGVTELGQH